MEYNYNYIIKSKSNYQLKIIYNRNKKHQPK